MSIDNHISSNSGHCKAREYSLNANIGTVIEKQLNKMDFKSEELRCALGRFATGVTIMSIADSQGRAMGVTANSFTSVSLEPPLVLWCLRREASIHEVFENNDLFAINMLGSESQATSARYAVSGQIPLVPGSFTMSSRGIPLLKNTITTFECQIIRRDNGGDHTILLARILDIHMGEDGDPLVFYQGCYRNLAKEKQQV